MQSLRVAMVAGLGTVLLGCASGPSVSTNYDPQASFSGYKTFAYIQPPDTGAMAGGGIRNPIVRKEVESAIQQTLQSKGYTLAAAGAEPDFAVGAIGTTQQQQQLNTTTTGGAWGGGYGGYYGGYGWRGGGVGMSTSTTTVSNYTEGTLVIDIIDGKSHDLVWRGSGTDVVSDVKNQEQMQAKIDNAVTSILAKFPPDQKK